MRCSICKSTEHNKRSCKENKKESINETQLHGFIWERELIMNVYSGTIEQIKNIKYGCKFDLPSEYNNLDHSNISIKTTCSKSIVCMSDCLRVFDSIASGDSFHLVVICYKQNDISKTKKIISIIELDLTNSLDILFPNIKREEIEELDKAVKSIPQKIKPSPEEHKNMYSIKNKLQEKSDIIQFNIKCNSTQSRLQCSFNKFDKFIEKYPKLVIAKSDNNIFRGSSISLEIKSERRSFKK
jgi:hypothetical protein